ncbi:hypothetical protein QCA50_010340 [Cerrena zonata]|uniref:F-box domain-containing protein n=1 Tax=Cerrena zonata TaxID=2478898 RepID=A0AAW0GCF2_9APHY
MHKYLAVSLFVHSGVVSLALSGRVYIMPTAFLIPIILAPSPMSSLIPIPKAFDTTKLRPIKTTPKTPTSFPLKVVFWYFSRSMLIQELMACSLVCRSWQEQAQEILFQIPVTWSSVHPLVESHLKGDCLMQTFPPLRNLTLTDIGLGLQEVRRTPPVFAVARRPPTRLWRLSREEGALLIQL